MAERTTSRLSGQDELKEVRPKIVYLGQVDRVFLESPSDNLDIVEYWTSTKTGIEILNIYPLEADADLRDYAKGLPRQEKTSRTYLLDKGSEKTEILETAEVMKRTFDRGTLTYCDLRSGRIGKIRGELNDDFAARDENTINRFLAQSAALKSVKANIDLDSQLGNRFLAKTAFLLGDKHFGERFRNSDYAEQLRKAAKEKNADVRSKLPVRGTGYLGPQPDFGLSRVARRGIWTLLLLRIDNLAALVVSTPLGRDMMIVIHPDTSQFDIPETLRTDGMVWEITTEDILEIQQQKYSDYLAARAKEI